MVGENWVADRLEADNMRVGDIEDTDQHNPRMLGKVGSPLHPVA